MGKKSNDVVLVNGRLKQNGGDVVFEMGNMKQNNGKPANGHTNPKVQEWFVLFFLAYAIFIFTANN